MNDIFSIGYSAFNLDVFYDVLLRNGIKAVADVRSSPFSKMYSDFNKDSLNNFLKAKSIYYVWLGDECGARADEEECYVGDIVDFRCVAGLPRFQAGIKRILQGAAKFNIVLMCAEKDPITCHRSILVSRVLKRKGAVVKHLLSDATIEPHGELEKRLLSLYKLNQVHLFKTNDELLDEAYERQGRKIAYRSDSDDDFTTGDSDD